MVKIRGGCCGRCEKNRAVFSPCQLHLPWMIFPMGCGGSRADAIIEPRYHESWTRETESTWLTNTDVETSLPVANSKSIMLHRLSFGLFELENARSTTACIKRHHKTILQALFNHKNYTTLCKKAKGTTQNTTTSCQLPDIAVM